MELILASRAAALTPTAISLSRGGLPSGLFKKDRARKAESK
jgi:hypothetical protein